MENHKDRQLKKIIFLALNLLELITFENFALYQYICKEKKYSVTKNLFFPSFFDIITSNVYEMFLVMFRKFLKKYAKKMEKNQFNFLIL